MKYAFLFVLGCLIGSNQSAWGMQIFVKITTGKTMTFDVELSDSIENVKSKIQDKEGFAPEIQKLTFNNIFLENNQTLADYSIFANSILYLNLPISAPSGLNLNDQVEIFATEIELK